MGLLLAWLEAGPVHENGDDHVHKRPLPDFETRLLCRQSYAAVPELQRIFDLERDRFDWEGDEPEYTR